MKYVRVVLAVEDDQLEHLDEYLCCFIETETIPPDFVVDESRTHNPIQGSYSTAAYDDRETALRGPWIDESDTATSDEMVNIRLPRFVVDQLAQFVDEEIGETGLPDPDPFGLHAFQAAVRELGLARWTRTRFTIQTWEIFSPIKEVRWAR